MRVDPANLTAVQVNARAIETRVRGLASGCAGEQPVRDEEGGAELPVRRHEIALLLGRHPEAEMPLGQPSARQSAAGERGTAEDGIDPA